MRTVKITHRFSVDRRPLRTLGAVFAALFAAMFVSGVGLWGALAALLVLIALDMVSISVGESAPEQVPADELV